MRRNNRNNVVPDPPAPPPAPAPPPPVPPWSQSFDPHFQLFLLKMSEFISVNKYEFINGICGVAICVLFVYSFDVVHDFRKHVGVTVYEAIINSESITLEDGLFIILYIMVFILIGVFIQNTFKSVLFPPSLDETKIFSDDEQEEKIRFCDGKIDVALWAKTYDEHTLMLLGHHNDYNRHRKLKIRLRVSTIEKLSWYWKCIGFQDKHVEIVSLHREFDI